MAKPPPKQSNERRPGLRALAALLPAVAGKALGRRGLAEGRIVADWAAIVGPEIAAHSLPERLAFEAGRRDAGTLHLLVAGPWAIELQHLEPQVVERINGHFGYRAVARLRLRQGTLPTRGAAVAPPAVPEEVSARIAAAAETVRDEGLRRALAAFGRAVAGRR